MNYNEVLEFLFSRPQGLKPQTQRMELLNRALGDPTRSYPTIHVAGSNGKGSVVGKIAKALSLSGYKVGIYTSPHLIDFKERIAINETLIDEEDVIAGIHRLCSLAEQLHIQPTFFEFTTLLAFLYFQQQNVDVAVIETGMGGRCDATHVIQPLLSIITSISLEHTEVLGKTLEAIALEKAGIIKAHTPVVLGSSARYEAIYARAKALHSPLTVSKASSSFFDEENSATAKLALTQLAPYFTLHPEAIAEALSWRAACRFEICGQCLLDVAHNPEAVFHLLQALYLFFPHKKWRFLVGFSKDKDYAACLELMGRVATHIHLVHAAGERAVPAEQLLAHSPPSSTAHSTLEGGFHEAYRAALDNDELLVVCGSFYIMSCVKHQLQVAAL